MSRKQILFALSLVCLSLITGLLQLIPANETPIGPNRVQIEIVGADRVPAQPKAAEQITPLIRQSFGICVNGVPLTGSFSPITSMPPAWDNWMSAMAAFA